MIGANSHFDHAQGRFWERDEAAHFTAERRDRKGRSGKLGRFKGHKITKVVIEQLVQVLLARSDDQSDLGIEPSDGEGRFNINALVAGHE